MEIKGHCYMCNKTTVYPLKELLDHSNLYKSVHTSVRNIPMSIVKKCQSCGSMIRIKVHIDSSEYFEVLNQIKNESANKGAK